MTSDKEKRITGFRKITPLGLKYLDLIEETLKLRYTRHYLGWAINRFENEVEQKARQEERHKIGVELDKRMRTIGNQKQISVFERNGQILLMFGYALDDLKYGRFPELKTKKELEK